MLLWNLLRRTRGFKVVGDKGVSFGERKYGLCWRYWKRKGREEGNVNE
jgi:hypothetical protein